MGPQVCTTEQEGDSPTVRLLQEICSPRNMELMVRSRLLASSFQSVVNSTSACLPSVLKSMRSVVTCAQFFFFQYTRKQSAQQYLFKHITLHCHHVSVLTLRFTWESGPQAKLTGHFSPVIPSFTNRDLSCRLTCSASGDDGRD
jgi:hypothetical protein